MNGLEQEIFNAIFALEKIEMKLNNEIISKCITELNKIIIKKLGE